MYTKPKKSLGQNFLIDKNIQKKIIRACNLSAEDIILEIGAGRGDLTVQLAPVSGQVYALEIDNNLYPVLDQQLINFTNVEVIKADILKFDIKKFLCENKIKQKIKVIGNIPYNISSPIIQRLICFRECIDEIFITVQKEFAKRVAASPGSKDYGSFSCFVQYYLEPKLIFDIKRNSFRPAPKVDSCFLALRKRAKPPVLVKDEEAFFELIRKAFNQRRKTLRNSLAGFLPPEKLDTFFSQTGIDKNVRPEDLSLQEFAILFK
jgi:16S rRNA (adenine1518-N6/adenine1519-N6)-dimethyltransferase